MHSVNLLICLSLALGCLCDKNKSEKVSSASVALTRETFDAEIAGKNVLVIFYSPKCELAQRFLPKFEKITETLNHRSDFVTARFNCDEDSQFCKLKNVNGLAVVLYVAGQKPKVVHYKGVKTEDGLVKFLVKNLGDSILRDPLKVPENLDALNDLTNETFTDHVAFGKHVVNFYFPQGAAAQRLEPTWSNLATFLEYDPSVSISRIDCTQFRHICQDYNIKRYPTLLLIVDGKKVGKYSKARLIEEIRKFIDEIVGVEKKRDAPKEAVVVAEQKSKPVHYKIVKTENGLVKIFKKNLKHSNSKNLLKVPEQLDALAYKTITDHQDAPQEVVVEGNGVQFTFEHAIEKSKNYGVRTINSKMFSMVTRSNLFTVAKLLAIAMLIFCVLCIIFVCLELYINLERKQGPELMSREKTDRYEHVNDMKISSGKLIGLSLLVVALLVIGLLGSPHGANQDTFAPST